MKKILFSAFAAIALSGAANASGDDTLAGAWSFQAEVQEDCEFAGSAEIRRTTVPNYFLCEMTVRDVCQGNEAIVRQSCVVTREGDKVKVNAVIKEYFLKPDAKYQPDNFRLTIEKETGDMVGELDSYGIWKAKWTRTDGRGTS